MNSILKSNLRSGGSRLVAAGLAVLVSVAFVVMAIVLTHSFNDTMTAQAEKGSAGTDVVVTGNQDPESDSGTALDSELASTIDSLDGVESAQLLRSGFGEATIDGTRTSVYPTDLPGYLDVDMKAGSLPASAQETLVYADVAEAMGLKVGDTLSLDSFENGGTPVDLTVSGIMNGSGGGMTQLYLTTAGMDALPIETYPSTIAVIAENHGAEESAVKITDEIAESVSHDSGQKPEEVENAIEVDGLTVQTHDQYVQAQIQQLTGSSTLLLGVVLGFGFIAVVVAMLVISNTFQVLVASRTKSLALMRTIGATKSQIKWATLCESFVLGVVGSVLGVVFGWAAASGLVALARTGWMPDFAPAQMTLPALAVGPFVGVVMTVIAGLSPARKATKVSPMVALRPVDVPAPDAKAGWIRTGLGLLLTIAGLGGTWMGATNANLVQALGCAVLAFLGVLLLSRVLMPLLVSGISRLLAAVTGGTPMLRIVGDNVRQAPRRTASTTAALLIGVTLVSTMTIGAASTQASITGTMAENNPIDGTVTGLSNSSLVTSSDIVEDSVDLDGFTGTVTFSGAEVTEDGKASDAKPEVPATIVAVDQDALDSVARVELTAPTDTQVLVGEGTHTADGAKVVPAKGSEATLTGAAGTEELEATLVGGLPSGYILVSDSTLHSLDADASTAATWMKIDTDAGNADIQALASNLSQGGASADLEAATLRAAISSAVSAVLTVVLVLLVAAIVIAVIGVSNTLSLSVLERKREASLLRALGMSRRSVASMISVESLLMGVVALVVGLGLGAFFGWAGPSSLMGQDDLTIGLTLPWGQIALIAAATLVATLAASLFPAARMSKVAPAEGLTAQ